MSPDDFDRFVAANANGLLRTAYLMVGDLHDAPDLVQETLFKVASKWQRVYRMEDPAAYARRILVNLALPGSSKRSRNRAELRATPAAETAANAAHLDIHDELFDALAALPPRQRAALVLRYFLDLSEAEVAAALGCGGDSHADRCALRRRSVSPGYTLPSTSAVYFGVCQRQ